MRYSPHGSCAVRYPHKLLIVSPFPAAKLARVIASMLKAVKKRQNMLSRYLFLADRSCTARALVFPFHDPQIVVKARSKYINVADKMCEFNDTFMLYMTTRLPNPHLSPENQAKV